MLAAIKSILIAIISGDFSIVNLYELAKRFLTGGRGDAIISLVSKVLESKVGIFIILAIGLIELLYGKKFLNFQKFAACAAAGYVAGVVIVSPIINKLFPLPTVVSGVAIAILMAVLSKMIYNVALYGGVAFVSYLFLFANGILEFKLPTEGNLVYTLIAVAVILLIMVIARKNVDRFVTALVGGLFISIAVKRLFDYTVILPGNEKLVQLALIIVLTVFGFIFQYRRRKRYYG